MLLLMDENKTKKTEKKVIQDTKNENKEEAISHPVWVLVFLYITQLPTGTQYGDAEKLTKDPPSLLSKQAN